MKTLFKDKDFRLYTKDIVLKSGVYEVVYFKWPGTLVQDFGEYNAYKESWNLEHVILYKPNGKV